MRTSTYTMNFGTLAAPTADQATGTYTNSVTVTLSAMSGATIRYTTNGSTPIATSPIYTSPLTFDVTTTLARKNSNDVVTYYLADHLGSIVQETNASGAVTLEREYDPWGVATQGASISGYAFTSREWDAEIGLHHYRTRYYDPERARFLSDDPIGLAGGTNQQRYVSNSPTRFTDPFGLQAMSCRPQLGVMKKVDDFFGRRRTDEERKAEIISTFLPPPAMVEMPSEVEANLARFLKKLPKAFKTGGQLRVDTVADDFLFTADVPGNAPVSSAVYQKLVNAARQTKEMIKSTLDAMGEVLHIKPKF